MAGWKLRKDKTQAETSSAETELSAVPDVSAVPAAAETEAEAYNPPSFNENFNEELPAVETENTLSPDFESDSDLHFEEEDSPLTLIDYSAPLDEDLLPLSQVSAPPVIAQPPPALPSMETEAAEPPRVEMPTPGTPSFNTAAAEAPEATGDFTSTLRMSREELAAAMAPPPAGIPPVAPFVLDAPLVSPATEEMPPRLVVRMGRLSAAFDLTKEVTVIGRPDSELHYYPDVEIDLDDAVSRRHAEIIKRDGGYLLVDTGSTNGTLLNGEKMPSHEERRLTHGDRIRVGERTEIIFE